MFPFRFPMIGYPYNNFYNYNRRNNFMTYNMPYKKNADLCNSTSLKYNNYIQESNVTSSKIEFEAEAKKDSIESSNNDYFFEIFGLKLFFDDILIICLLFFLYEEGVKDQELFISLILLLLS